MKKYYYAGETIYNTCPGIYIVGLDGSKHSSLTSAQCWIDYILK